MSTDMREDLVNDLCMFIMSNTLTDMQDIKHSLYMILNSYGITERCTEIAVLEPDKNELYLKKFLIAKTVNGLTPRSIEFYKKTIMFVFNRIDKNMDDVTAEDIRYYMAVRQRIDRVSKVTIGNEMRVLSSFYAWMHNEGIVSKNPMAKVDRIKVEKTKKEALTEMEIEKLRMAVRDERERMMLEVLLSTGCRVSEFVQIELIDIEGSRILVHGKGQKDRYVYLNAKAEFAIVKYLDLRTDKNPYLLPRMMPVAQVKNEKKENCHLWWMDPEKVAEGHADKSSVECIFRNMAKRAGVERANPHKFRRTCATMALRRGMPIEQVSKMLGHEEISTTQIYLDLNEDDLEQAHRKYVI